MITRGADMRKPRVILFEDDPAVLNLLKLFFEMRGYDVVACRAPVRCPVYDHDDRCDNRSPCADIMLADYRMPRMTAVDLFRNQARMGCRLSNSSKAVMSACVEPSDVDRIREMGCAFFQKPFRFDALEEWLFSCENQMDLSGPLGFKRKEQRENCCVDVSLQRGVPGSSCNAALVNRSDSGACLRLDMPLMRDEVVDLRFVDASASGRFLVRWTARVPNNGYLAGLSCC
jgi:CheY-like chemotaxis protein